MVGFCWRRRVLIFCLFMLFFPAFGAAKGSNIKEQLELLIAKYGKEKIIYLVLKLRKNRITLWVNGRFVEFTGPPSSNYVTMDTLVEDLKKAGIGIGQLEESLSAAHSGSPEMTAPPQQAKLKEPLVEKLRQAALECRVSAFSLYMNPQTRGHVEEVEEIQQRLTEVLEEFYRTSREFFGERVSTSQGMVRFRIEGKDPRWVDILGPQWERLLKEYPDQPRFLVIMAEFGWEEECKVIQRFQLCLENPSQCREFELPGSALRLTQRGGSWVLEEAKPAREWDRIVRMGEGLVKLVQWASAYLSGSRKREPYEELMISFAREYMERLHDLMKAFQSTP